MQEDSIRIALLEKGQETTEKELSTLREAITEISKVNVRISELLTIHQVKLDQQQKNDDDVNRKVEDGIKNLIVKMDKDRDDIYKKMETSETTLSTEIKGLRDKVFTVVGAVVVINALITIVGPFILTKITSGGLTNEKSDAIVRILDAA
jgi:two-component sensor histidine kinase